MCDGINLRSSQYLIVTVKSRPFKVVLFIYPVMPTCMEESGVTHLNTPISYLNVWEVLLVVSRCQGRIPPHVQVGRAWRNCGERAGSWAVDSSSNREAKVLDLWTSTPTSSEQACRLLWLLHWPRSASRTLSLLIMLIPLYQQTHQGTLHVGLVVPKCQVHACILVLLIYGLWVSHSMMISCSTHAYPSGNTSVNTHLIVLRSQTIALSQM